MTGSILTRNLDSSILLRADFDPFMESMKVYFRTGAVYEFYGVQQDTFDEFVNADSSGKYFVQNVKYRYDFSKKA